MQDVKPPSPASATRNTFDGLCQGFNSLSRLEQHGGNKRLGHLPPIYCFPHPSRICATLPAVGIQTDSVSCPNAFGFRSVTPEDIEMLSPRPSKGESHQTQPAAAINPNSACSCTGDERRIERSSPASHTTAAIDVGCSYARVPINDLLNQPLTPPYQWSHQKGANPSSAVNNDSGGTDHPMTASATSSLRSPSPTSSDSTIRPPFTNISEERGILLNALYNICMDSTASYVSTLAHNSRHWNSHLRCARARYHPYSPRRHGRSHTRSADARPATLMDNISLISTHIWRRARGDEMAPHRAEADAVGVMRDLYAWSEVVATGLESEGIDIGDEEDGDLGMKVGRAAKKLCQVRFLPFCSVLLGFCSQRLWPYEKCFDDSALEFFLLWRREIC